MHHALLSSARFVCLALVFTVFVLWEIAAGATSAQASPTADQSQDAAVVSQDTAAAPEPVAPPTMTFEDLFIEDIDGRLPDDLEWRPGTQQLRLTWDGGDGEQIMLFDAATGEHQILASMGDLVGETATSDEEDLGTEDDSIAEDDPEIDDLRFSPSGDGLHYGVDGDLFTFDLKTRQVRRLTETDAEEEMANPSPDGRHLALVRDNDLYLLDVVELTQQRLTSDGMAEVIFNGITDWVYWEEIWGRDATGSWWSDDSKRLAFYRMDDRDLPVYPLVDTSSPHPEVELQRYPKAGDVLPKVEVRVYDLVTGDTVTLATHDDPDTYLARVHWLPSGEHLLVERLNRDQTQLDVLRCNVSDGGCEVLMSESWPTWINLGDELTVLDDGGFVWSSEKSGWKQLYLFDAEGQEVRRLTPEGWSVASLSRVDEEHQRVIYTAYSTVLSGATERHVFTVPLAGGEAERLTEAAGWHGVKASNSGYWVHTFSDANTPPRQEIRHFSREVSWRLPHTPPQPILETLPHWRLFTLAGPEGSTLPAQMMVPAGLEPGQKAPVITYHYGGPASQVVANRWRQGNLRSLWHKFMASRGYAVLSVDNQASTHFGKAGEDLLHRRFGEVELAGQLAGVAYLKSLPWVDSQRLGLWGWSGGGSHTLYSLLRSPGVWKAGVSGAPVTDWRLYDAIWMERYLDHPDTNGDGYAASAPLTYAAQLEDALLLVHGTGDNNVHVQNSLNMAAAFVEAGVQFEQAIYPGASHSFTSFKEAGRRHLFRRMTDFFDRHLLEAE